MQRSAAPRVIRLAACVPLVFCAARVSATTLRVVTYNINADTTDFNSTGVPNSTYDKTVLSAIGLEHLNGNAQPIDILTLQELSDTPTVTLQAITNDLNSLYGAGTYAYDLNSPTTSGVGNGPNGVIYNTKTVQEVLQGSSTAHSVNTAGAYRTPLRYEFQPVGSSSSNDFYVYVDHAKADNGYESTRQEEFDGVREDYESLGSNVHAIFTGDYNLTGGSSEPGYQDLLAPAGTKLAGNGYTTTEAGLVDPVTTSFTSDVTGSNPNTKYYTESATDLSARFDVQLTSPAAAAGSSSPGLQVVPDTDEAFGNDYYANGVLSTDLYGGEAVNSSYNVDALADLNGVQDPVTPSDTNYRQTVLNDLTLLTDHLPVVADYTIVPAPEPTSVAAMFVGAAMLVIRRRRRI